ncbi:hypothetical protein BJ912DRAFT_1142302 [Pholiota molesta]|nr:hypothetical protein BJ912DRAFT_1142302 [Pholiota molesta]
MMSMDVSSDSNMGIFVPPELCACIIESGALPQCDLYTLVSVSRSFWKECERQLYNHPTLLNKAKIKRFCATIRRRPHLAERIFKLTLYMPPQTDFQVADLSGLTRTLHLAVNLKSLEIFSDSTKVKSPNIRCPVKGEALQTWILEGHAFKLRELTNNYFELTALQPFIESQPVLERLNLICGGKVDLKHIPLRELKMLFCLASGFQEMVSEPRRYNWKIQVLFLVNVNSSQEADTTMIQNLYTLRGTLRMLRITRFMCGEVWEIQNLVGGVSQMRLSALKMLEIQDFCWKDGYSNSPFGAFSFPRGTFPQLVALRLCPPFKRPDNPSVSATESFYTELNTEDGRLAAATRIMEAIPMLRTLTLMTPRYEYIHNRNTGDGPLVKLRLARPIFLQFIPDVYRRL